MSSPSNFRFEGSGRNDGPYLPSCVGLSSSVGGWTVAERPYANNTFDVSFA